MTIVDAVKTRVMSGIHLERAPRRVSREEIHRTMERLWASVYPDAPANSKDAEELREGRYIVHPVCSAEYNEKLHPQSQSKHSQDLRFHGSRRTTCYR